MIAGETGSGKSTLFHVIITKLALYCSPEEVEFYLLYDEAMGSLETFRPYSRVDDL